MLHPAMSETPDEYRARAHRTKYVPRDRQTYNQQLLELLSLLNEYMAYDQILLERGHLKAENTCFPILSRAAEDMRNYLKDKGWE